MGVTLGPFSSIFSHGTGETKPQGKNFLITAHPIARPLLQTPSPVHGLTAQDGDYSFHVCMYICGFVCVCACVVGKVKDYTNEGIKVIGQKTTKKPPQYKFLLKMKNM